MACSKKVLEERPSNMRWNEGVLYETEVLREVTGPAIRPGGLSLTDKAMEYCGFKPGSIICDIGSGAGSTLKHLRHTYGMRAFGIDPSKILLGESRCGAQDIPVARGIAEALPFRDNVFDGIFCECVFSLISSPEKALAEFVRVLKPGALLVMTDVYLRLSGHCPRPVSLLKQSCLQGARPKNETEELLARYGFSMLLWEDHTKDLKELAVQLIFAQGPLNPFWKSICSDDITFGLPGYYLLAAQNRMS